MADARPFHWEFKPEEVDREVFRIEGGRRLEGSVRISGAKNAALKLMAAATLTGERCRFTNVPEIEDVRVLGEVLRDIGVTVDHPEPNVYEVAGGDAEWLFVPLEAAAKMRASFILLGPLLTRFGRVIISNPGGDRIGRRPVNLHVDAMRALGAEIEYRNGYYFAKAPGRLRGGRVTFPQITVMGTENAMLAATLAVGHTIEVEGRRRLRGAQHAVVSDRIEAGTFVVAAAVTHGRVTLENAPCGHFDALLEIMSKVGVSVSSGEDTVEVDATAADLHPFKSCDIETQPYPGLATDLQPATCVLLTQAAGVSHVTETIFEDRLEWLGELRRMGAQVEIPDQHHATIHGPTPLHGAEVEIGDLRAGASLILAALAAEGVTTIRGAHHVHRGYEKIDKKFLELGARIERTAEGK